MTFFLPQFLGTEKIRKLVLTSYVCSVNFKPNRDKDQHEVWDTRKCKLIKITYPNEVVFIPTNFGVYKKIKNRLYKRSSDNWSHNPILINLRMCLKLNWTILLTDYGVTFMKNKDPVHTIKRNC